MNFVKRNCIMQLADIVSVAKMKIIYAAVHLPAATNGNACSRCS